MKNIKTFEGFFDFLKTKPKKVRGEVLYKIINNEDEEISFLDNHILEEETDKEKEILEKYRKNTNIKIIKFDDEWFLVTIKIHWGTALPRPPIKSFSFKCDTIDGVIQCLDDNKELAKDSFWSY